MAYKDWTSDDWTGGLIDKAIDNLIPDNASRDCSNVICRYIGLIQKRTGRSKLNSSALAGGIQGIFPFYYGTLASPTRRLMVAANGNIAYWNSATSAFVNVHTGWNASALVSMCSYTGRLLYCNGVNVPREWDGTTDQELDNAPSTSQFFVPYAGKVFTVDAAEPSYLRWCNNYARTDWSVVNKWGAKDGDGDKITNVKNHNGYLTVFKRYSTHVFSGTTFDLSVNPFKLTEVDTNVGCVGKFAAAVDGPLCYFVADSGFCVFDGSQVANLTENRIPGLWATVNGNYLSGAAIEIDEYGLVWIALPVGSSTTNNAVLVYDPVTGAFWPWTANLSCFAHFDDGTNKYFYGGGVGTADAGYVLKLNTGTDDSGTAINAYWTSEYFTADTPEREKKAKKIFVTDSESTANVFTLTVSRTTTSRGAYTAPTLKSTDGKLREFKLIGDKKFLEISYKLAHSALGTAEARKVTIPHKVKSRPGV